MQNSMQGLRCKLQNSAGSVLKRAVPGNVRQYPEIICSYTKMSVDYASGLSEYKNKGVCGLPEVKFCSVNIYTDLQLT